MSRRFFNLLALALSLSCFNGGCMCPSSNGYPDWGKYRAAELADRKGKVQPVIDALERYKQDHGKYPARLDDLTTGRLLEAMPDLASNLDHTGAAGRVRGARAGRVSGRSRRNGISDRSRGRLAGVTPSPAANQRPNSPAHAAYRSGSGGTHPRSCSRLPPAHRRGSASGRRRGRCRWPSLWRIGPDR